eukprot:TRINITY_DN17451_c0_g1_i1.p2 TRINITY_DN17451_c0_g1~~TRINITY_DN17451_c0_g1_i1.p2  ORF type:complete len:145 (-),score=13.62 TRINITY_DN17451_c0_g1_i1:158-592(-)
MGCAPVTKHHPNSSSLEGTAAPSFDRAWREHPACSLRQGYLRRHQVRLFICTALPPPLGLAGSACTRRKVAMRVLHVARELHWGLFADQDAYVSKAQLLCALQSPADREQLRRHVSATLIAGTWRGYSATVSYTHLTLPTKRIV